MKHYKINCKAEIELTINGCTETAEVELTQTAELYDWEPSEVAPESIIRQEIIDAIESGNYDSIFVDNLDVTQEQIKAALKTGFELKNWEVRDYEEVF